MKHRFPNSPEKVTLGTKLGDVWLTADGRYAYEVIEKYGGLMMLNLGTGGESTIRTHNLKEYTLQSSSLDQMSRIARSAEEIQEELK